MNKSMKLIAAATMLTPASAALAQASPQPDVAQALEAARQASAQAQAAADAAAAAAAAAEKAADAAASARSRALEIGVAEAALPQAAATPRPAEQAADAAPAAGQSPLDRMAFNFNGYIRTGLAANSKGGDQVCFGLPGVLKYRLGNECDTFAEFQPSVTFPVKDGIKATYTFMVGYYNSNPMILGGSENSGDFDIRQNWIGFTGFSGPLEGAQIWGGRRYYQRHDIHVQDFFYWSQRGQGVGIENVRTAVGNLSVAVMRGYNDSGSSATPFKSGVAGTSLDVRLAGIKTNAGGTLELGIEGRRSSTQGSAPRAKDGFLLTAEHVQQTAFGGKNTFVVQYGYRAGANLSTNDAGAYFLTTDRTSALRVLDQIVIEPSPRFSAYFGAIFQRDRNFRLNDHLIGRRDWLSIGTRPQWHWSDNLTSALEVGYDSIHLRGDSAGILSGRTAKLVKVTLAPVVLKLARGFFERPELRLYGTCARWNRNADLLALQSGVPGGNITGNSNYAGQRDGCSVGAHIEAWW